MKAQSIYQTTGKTGKSMLLLLPMILLTFIFVAGGRPDFSGIDKIVAFLITFLFFNYLFFRILYTGKTDRYRAIGFITLALFFALTFIVNLIRQRGSMSFSNENLISCEIPFCHIVITMILIPLAVTRSIIFPGSITEGFASISVMIVIWLGVSLALGRGFCSWGCFYGGWDDGTSRILKKPVIRKINPVFRWVSFAVLLLIAFWSAMAISPEYCNWLCPFKTVTEFEKVTSFETLMKTIVFVSLFAALVVILPVLTKKRIQCATFCPMGALCALTNKVNVFEVRIDKGKCTQCYKCITSCPTLSINKNDIERGTPSVTCMKCGKCIDECAQQALSYHIKGTPVNKNRTLARMLFLYPAFMLLVIFTAGSMQQGIVLIFKLITTGRLL
jgi:polyferredoxin